MTLADLLLLIGQFTKNGGCRRCPGNLPMQLLHACEIERSKAPCDLRVPLTLGGIHRHQPAANKIALRTPGRFLRIFRHELLQAGNGLQVRALDVDRSEEHTSELQSLMRISYAVFCLKK